MLENIVYEKDYSDEKVLKQSADHSLFKLQDDEKKQFDLIYHIC